jgi:hypothetical protein
MATLFTDLPVEVVNALEAARRVSYAFHGKHTRPAYEGRWDDFLPQHESLIALDAWLAKVDKRA